MTTDEAATLLQWLWDHPRLLGWFCLSTFAGLRPEEAEKTTWRDVNFEEQWIRVQAQTTKTRQRRIVYPKPIVFAWLRAVAGGPKWKEDVTRHTAASMWFSVDSGGQIPSACSAARGNSQHRAALALVLINSPMVAARGGDDVCASPLR